MRWRGRRQSSNVEDHRSGGGSSGGFGRAGRGGGFKLPRGMGGGGMRRASGGSIKGLIFMAIVYFALKFFLGIDLLSMLGGGSGMAPSTQPQVEQPQPSGKSGTNRTGPTKTGNAREDELAQFAGVILAETEDVWHGIFKSLGKKYPEPKLRLFTSKVRSACGHASAASGPFYCPGDSKVYIDLAFFDQLSRQFKASGDFAQAYVLAHEVGHHVQNVIGILPAFNKKRRTLSKQEANRMSIQVELQADCFAGIWGHFTAQKGLLERGDLEEALNAATQIGDDAIQKRTQGYVVPESFNHGTSKQRKYWFRRGFESGRLDQCDTFSARDL
jgi:predicted metalloprotease